MLIWFPHRTAQGAQRFQVGTSSRCPRRARYGCRLSGPFHLDRVANLSRSRQSLKKYVKANNNINATDNMFDSLFNKALKAGVDKGVFEQPKGAYSPARRLGDDRHLVSAY